MYAGRRIGLPLFMTTADRLFDPIARICAEPGLHRPVVSFHGPHQAEIAFFDQIFEAETLVEVSPSDVHHEAEVRLHHVVAGIGVAFGNLRGGSRSSSAQKRRTLMS